MISNNFTGIGRLTKDPELRVTSGGKSVLDFSIAINRPFTKEHPESDFIDCTAWGGTAEAIAKYFSKGSKIGVSGRVEVKPYEDKDKNKRKSWKVILDSFEFIESKKNRNEYTEDTEEADKDITTNDTKDESEGEEDGELPFK